MCCWMGRDEPAYGSWRRTTLYRTIRRSTRSKWFVKLPRPSDVLHCFCGETTIPAPGVTLVDGFGGLFCAWRCGRAGAARRRGGRYLLRLGCSVSVPLVLFVAGCAWVAFLVPATEETCLLPALPFPTAPLPTRCSAGRTNYRHHPMACFRVYLPFRTSARDGGATFKGDIVACGLSGGRHFQRVCRAGRTNRLPVRGAACARRRITNMPLCMPHLLRPLCFITYCWRSLNHLPAFLLPLPVPFVT